jgi:hypothetical protein
MAAYDYRVSANMPVEETAAMPPTADDPQSNRVSAETPAADPQGDRDGMDRSAADPPAAASAAAAAGAPGDMPEPSHPAVQRESAPNGEPRRRRRRRRRPPRVLSAGAEPAPIASGEAASGEVAGAGNPLPGEGGATSPRPEVAWPAGERPHRRRPRRRRPASMPSGSAPRALGSALPPIEPTAPAAGGDAAAAEGSAEAMAGVAEGGSTHAARYLRRPVRGRRRLPRPPGLQRGTTEGVSPPDAGEVPANAAAAGAPRAEGEFPRRRHRRRPPRTGDAVPAGERQSPDVAPRDPNQPPRDRGRYRRSGDERPREAQPSRDRARAARREPGREPRGQETGGLARREPGDRGARSRGPGGPRDGRGRGHDAAPRRVEQKLYALESMVDRGFEDVADEAEESGTRRVHWTIVKRTVADQKSGKAMSAVYVLQRDGTETEFPNLGAARATANKTIVHPEKLTLSKAEHVAAKSSK